MRPWNDPYADRTWKRWGPWRDWPYRAGLQLRHHDHAGVGHLELVDEHALLAAWRFTLGQNLQAIRVVDAFADQVRSGSS